MWIATLLSAGVLVASKAHDIQRYEQGYQRATTLVYGHVVATHERRRGDTVDVEWSNGTGEPLRWTFAVFRSGDYAIGDEFRVWVEPGVGVYPADPGAVGLTDPYTTIVLTVVVLILVQLAWALRFIRVRRAMNAAPVAGRARLRFQVYRPGKAAAWLHLNESEPDERFQRVMWEPWLGELDVREEFAVTTRQAKHRGPVVVDVLGHGRVWPAGRVRYIEPALAPAGTTGFLPTPWWLVPLPTLFLGGLALLFWGVLPAVFVTTLVGSVGLLAGGRGLWRSVPKRKIVAGT